MIYASTGKLLSVLVKQHQPCRQLERFQSNWRDVWFRGWEPVLHVLISIFYAHIENWFQQFSLLCHKCEFDPEWLRWSQQANQISQLEHPRANLEINHMVNSISKYFHVNFHWISIVNYLVSSREVEVPILGNQVDSRNETLRHRLQHSFHLTMYRVRLKPMDHPIS